MSLYALSSDPFRSFATAIEAFQYARATAGAKAVWAVVRFDDLPMFHVFFSSAVTSYHAEELFFENFPTILTRATIRKTGLVQRCSIAISHSPCVDTDPRASHQLPGWPRSCLEKFKKLARDYPLLQFDVTWENDYRTLEEATSDRHLGRTLYVLMRRTQVFADIPPENLPPVQRALLKSALQEFLPGTRIDEEAVSRVLVELRRLSRNTGFLKAMASNEKAASTFVLKAVGSALHLTEMRMQQLGSSVMARALDPLLDMADLGIHASVGLPNLTIRHAHL